MSTPSPSEPERHYRVTVTIDLHVHDPRVITRVTENVDGWREQMYDLDESGVAGMLALNLQHRELNDIDGWADMRASAADADIPRIVDVERLS